MHYGPDKPGINGFSGISGADAVRRFTPVLPVSVDADHNDVRESDEIFKEKTDRYRDIDKRQFDYVEMKCAVDFPDLIVQLAFPTDRF